MADYPIHKKVSAIDKAIINRRQSVRMLKDRLARHSVALGGLCVILAIVLIFVYLLYEVLPLFESAGMTEQTKYGVPGGRSRDSFGYAIDELAEVGIRYTRAGHVIFFNLENGRVLEDRALPIPENAKVTAYASGNPNSGVVAFGLSNGSAIILKHRFATSFKKNTRTVTPELDFFLGEQPQPIYRNRRPIDKMAIQSSDDSATLVAWSSGQPAVITRYSRRESFLDDEVTWEADATKLDVRLETFRFILLDDDQRVLYIADAGGILLRYAVRDLRNVSLSQQTQIAEQSNTLTQLKFLTGHVSLLAGESNGRVSHWFPVRRKGKQPVLKKIREFTAQQASIEKIAPEFNRKGFLTADASGNVVLYHSTAHRTLASAQLSADGLVTLNIAPRANAFIAEEQSGRVHFWRIRNEHPEISWTSLWGKVWYEGYSEPKYIWQSSAANNDFEPKLSLIPLTFGTLKAAIYAMLMATPIAIFGAIYTAYFMAPALRRMVKPTIEIMEALPTVILGFLAGLWLAPALERYLLGAFAILLIVPLGCLIFAYVWQSLPERMRAWVADGWQPLLLMPLVLALFWLGLRVSAPLEQVFFDGSMRAWLADSMGIDFDQRNAIVVGLAMGFAVIPTIFSITEDAVFGVPKHLTQGSLALGATRWQTMTRVVILTASPGIFSAVMIGFGRAVGETMIVLMATGNTPVMDFSIFQGMRTLAANIAVEMPESEVGSTHFRVLFLAALVLFAFTFAVNTLAEIIRHRLRNQYSSL